MCRVDPARLVLSSHSSAPSYFTTHPHQVCLGLGTTQQEWRTDPTALLLYNYNLESDLEDYK